MSLGTTCTFVGSALYTLIRCTLFPFACIDPLFSLYRFCGVQHVAESNCYTANQKSHGLEGFRMKSFGVILICLLRDS